ncbi:Retrotransposable element Tf2 [Senna tora]|uniref:Retrotransposable element Tf2 n=1 Tax=Senna tora TaxID=362788 RepID=A0A834W8J0_9FABA|nr:Retrotransposable element Tf2 [Senna tora]
MGDDNKAKPAGVWSTVKPFVNGGASEPSFRGMVRTRMESRVDSVEKNVGEMKGDVTVLQGEVTEIKNDVNSLKEWVLEIKDCLARLEKKQIEEHEQDRGEGSGSHGGDNDREQRTDESSGKEVDKHRKLELPIFDGEEAIGWLFKVERYFSLNRMQDGEKLEAVASQQGNNYEMLMAHKQVGTVEEYRERFELLSAPLKDAPEEMLIGAYQNGLKEDIRAELRMVKAQSLLEVLDLSHKVEERNRTDTSGKSGTASQFSQGTESKRSDEKKVTSSTASTAKSRVRRLTLEEVAEKRRKGECFTCDEKYNPAHQCKNKHLHLLIMAGPIEETEDDILLEELDSKGEDERHGGSLMALSMNSIASREEGP